VTTPKSARRLADLALLGVAIAWGATFVMVKEAVVVVGPLTFVALRFVIASAAMAPWIAVGRSEARHRGDRGLVIASAVAGACLAAGYLFQTAGLQHTSASRAGFITGLNVVLVPIFLAFVARKQVSTPVIAGVALAVLGLALLAGQDVIAADTSTALGDALVLGCAVAFALHILVVGHYAPRHSIFGLTFGQIVVAAALATVGAIALEPITPEGLWSVLPAAAFTGLVCTVAAFLIQVVAQRFTSPSHTALAFASEPVFAVLFAYWLIGERLGPFEIVGCVLILAGTLAAQLDKG
jgi:drug/metabolite transporter (DMT)-like permease